MDPHTPSHDPVLRRSRVHQHNREALCPETCCEYINEYLTDMSASSGRSIPRHARQVHRRRVMAFLERPGRGQFHPRSGILAAMEMLHQCGR